MSPATGTLIAERRADRPSSLRRGSGDQTAGQLREALARLLAGNEVPHYVKGEIATSWRRAADSGLAPDRVAVPYEPDVDRDGSLVRAAEPVLDQLAHDLAGTRVGVVLSDGDGQLVDRRVADRALLDEMDRISLAPGYVYAEHIVGTNGIGTALAQRSPAAVEGEEHFAEALITVACAGAPITDPRSGRIAGVIDLTSLAGDGSALMLPLAARAAHEVEQRLLDDSGVTERLLLQRFLQERRRAKGPLVFVTDRTIITNAAADRLVVPGDESSLRACAERLTTRNKGARCKLLLSSGDTVSVHCEPILDGDAPAGTILRLRVVSDTGPATGRSNRGSASFGWESLTETERSVTNLVAQGLTNREAGERLFLSPHTVGFHLRSIYRKLGVSSRVDLTRSALEHGLGRERAAVALSG